jgi:hypothetical protein
MNPTTDSRDEGPGYWGLCLGRRFSLFAFNTVESLELK